MIAAVIAPAAEKVLDFSAVNENQPPPGFRSLVAGTGKPGDWRVVFDNVPPTLAPLSPSAAPASKRAVISQVGGEFTDEHFPILVYDGETFDDFKLTTRFKVTGGALEQMAGIAFRLQDEKNFYVMRASAMGNNFRFYKMVNGVRSPPIGPEIPIPKGVWHELAIECKGNTFRCQLNGKEIMPELTDNSFAAGKIAFWSKSDSKCSFVDTRITYTPRERLVQAIIREQLQLNPRLLGLKILNLGENGEPWIIASDKAEDVGRPGTAAEKAVIIHGDTAYEKRRDGGVAVTVPVRDRNGDIIAAARIVMQSFGGQTEKNSVLRAQPIIKDIQKRLRSEQDLRE